MVLNFTFAICVACPYSVNCWRDSTAITFASVLESGKGKVQAFAVRCTFGDRALIFIRLLEGKCEIV